MCMHDVKIKQTLSCAVQSAVQHLASVMKEKGRKCHERKRSQASRKERLQLASVMKEKILAYCIVAVSISIHNPPHEGT